MKVSFVTIMYLLFALTSTIDARRAKAKSKAASDGGEGSDGSQTSLPAPCKANWIFDGTENVVCAGGQVCHEGDPELCQVTWIDPSTQACDPGDDLCCNACNGCCQECPNYDATKTDCPDNYNMPSCNPPECCEIIGCGGRRMLRAGRGFM